MHTMIEELQAAEDCIELPLSWGARAQQEEVERLKLRIEELEAEVELLRKKKLNRSLMTSNQEAWETPDDMFAALDAEFDFDLDVCADAANAKLNHYYDKQIDAFAQPWVGRIWMNPPYGKEIKKWVARAHRAVETHEAEVVVCLLPARIGSRWWVQHVLQADEIREVQGRLRFKGALSGAPFPSVVVIFKRSYKWKMHPPARFQCDKQGRRIEV